MDSKTNNNPDLRALPKIDEFLQLAESERINVDAPHALRRAAARQMVEELRREITGGKSVDLSKNALLARWVNTVRARREHSLSRVVNATGVVLHTGLGRAPLPEAAVAAMVQASQACALEIERESGERGHRDSVIAKLLRELLGVGDGTAVNNNAAATMLAVNTFALGKEVIISRGELVEIGGSYRMPAVVERGGAKLVEVGTTNRTRAKDYQSAIGPGTGLIMKVHTSNYRVAGFTEDASLPELVAVARKAGVPIVHDLGSGLLTKTLAPALADEPTVADSVAAGPDVTLFSGDKLLGGPQAGIIAGAPGAVAAIRGNPMFRAMRLDKTILAALEQTLRLFLEGDAAHTVPALERLNLTIGVLVSRAEALAEKLQKSAPALDVVTEESFSEAGSGSAPTIGLRTCCVGISMKGVPAAELARKLRLSRPAVFTRVREDRVWLDPRTLGAGDEDRILESLRNM